MRTLCCLSMAAWLALAARAGAADLAAIDRSIGKEPAYESKDPRYCLLVFGSEAKVRVWVVLDGDVLYVDRNGNGNLTDPGERLAASGLYRDRKERPDVEVMRTFELACWGPGGGEPILTCGPEVRWFYLHQLLPREGWHDRDWVRFYQEKPFDLAVTTRAGGAQRARLRFASSAREALVVPFDGARRFAPSAKFGPHSFRSGEQCRLAVELCAAGLNATAKTETSEFPDGVHPVAEIEFPPGREGGEPIRRRVELKGRC